MIRAIIISPDQELAGQLHEALTGFRNVWVAKVLHQYPTEAKLPGLLKTTVPELIFLSAESIGEAKDVARQIEEEIPGTPIVAFDRSCEGQAVVEILRAGAKDFLAPPFEAKSLQEMIRRVRSMLDNRRDSPVPDAQVFAFLPAKAGAGSTTVAVNTSVALARMHDTRVLLVDLDLNTGMVGFLLGVKSSFSVIDAAENAADMDENLWSKIVSSIGTLDILPAGSQRFGFRIENGQITRILRFAQWNYNALCLDLSGMLEMYSVELLHEVKQIFLVCTPEIPSLHLASARLEYLRRLDLDDKVSVVVNRVENNPLRISLSDMETVFRKKIFLTLPNSYETAREAWLNGKPVKASSELGTSFAKFAHTMLGQNQPQTAQQPQRSFLDTILKRKSEVAKA
jgi:pilus assembly protein CpaE